MNELRNELRLSKAHLKQIDKLRLKIGECKTLREAQIFLLQYRYDIKKEIENIMLIMGITTSKTNLRGLERA